jgi:predicted nucleic acid-binding protein
VSVLVDTSIWIRFLSNDAACATRLDELLEQEDVCRHDCVYGELLIGDRGGRAAFLASYALMRPAPVASHEEVVTLVRERHLHGRGIGWIDAQLLASALLGRLKLWTADACLAEVAADLGVAHD